MADRVSLGMPQLMTQNASRFPLHLGSPEQFAQIRGTLRSAGFDETTLRRELKIPSMSQLGRVRWPELDTSSWPEALRCCASLFLFGQRASQARLIEQFGSEVIDCFIAAGLLHPTPSAPELLMSPVLLYPAAGFLIASDRPDDPDDPAVSPREMPPDVVFPGIYGGTLRFLELLPVPARGDALDLCGGCGIGALCLARTAQTAVSADITARATQFAGFNALLNGAGNVRAACGDLYEAVPDRQFDVITAHPPYVPALGSQMLYRDAGDVGEDITRNIVAGLPAHLRPGGKALVLCQGRDAEDGAFEERARHWLGANEGRFDVVFALHATKTIEQEAQDMTRRVQQPTPDELAELAGRFRKLGTRQFVYGALAIQRHSAAELTPWTARVRLSAEARSADFDRLVAWGRRQREPGFSQWLAQARPRLSSAFEVHVRHVVADGALVPAEFIFKADQPFASALRVDGWVAPLVAQMDGSATLDQVYTSARKGGKVPPDFELKDLIQLFANLIERGYLQADPEGEGLGRVSGHRSQKKAGSALSPAETSKQARFVRRSPLGD
jgi:SAM-dependent methyltransferase